MCKRSEEGKERRRLYEKSKTKMARDIEIKTDKYNSWPYDQSCAQNCYFFYALSLLVTIYSYFVLKVTSIEQRVMIWFYTVTFLPYLLDE